MAKQIRMQYKGNTYTLEFNRRQVERMERNGFVVDADRPYTMVKSLFLGALQMHHKNINQDLAMEIWDAQNKKDDLLSALIEMYAEPISALMSDAEEEAETPTWELT